MEWKRDERFRRGHLVESDNFQLLVRRFCGAWEWSAEVRTHEATVEEPYNGYIGFGAECSASKDDLERAKRDAVMGLRRELEERGLMSILRELNELSS
jgi:hypothetical protein